MFANDRSAMQSGRSPLARVGHAGGVLLVAVISLIVVAWVFSQLHESVHHGGALSPLGSRRLVQPELSVSMQSTSVGASCSGVNTSVTFRVVANRTVCAKYYTTIVAASVNECALSCSSTPGCSTFSFEEQIDMTGCRISQCVDRDQLYCGHSVGFSTLAVEHQCFTVPSESSKLYSIDAFKVAAVRVQCQSQYVQDVASSPACCAVACQLRTGCKNFSFNYDDGCRLSACGDPLAFGSSTSVCSPSRQCNDQSGIELPDQGSSTFYMYTLLDPSFPSPVAGVPLTAPLTSNGKPLVPQLKVPTTALPVPLATTTVGPVGFDWVSPVVVKVTTAAPVTTLAVTTTTTTTTTTIRSVDSIIEGNFGMTLPDAQIDAAIADLAFKSAIEEGVATSVNVSKDYVSASLQEEHLSASSHEGGRTLASTLHVGYIIALPASDFTSQQQQSSYSSVKAISKEGLTATINSKLATAQANYKARVIYIEKPSMVVGTVADESSDSGASILLRNLVYMACLGMIGLCVIIGLKKLKCDDRVKTVGYSRLDRIEASMPEFQMSFDTGSDSVTFTFKELPLNIAFWDELPLNVCNVTKNSEAERLGVKKGWVATHVNGQRIVGSDSCECVAMVNKTALEVETAGGLLRVTPDAPRV